MCLVKGPWFSWVFRWIFCISVRALLTSHGRAGRKIWVWPAQTDFLCGPAITYLLYMFLPWREVICDESFTRSYPSSPPIPDLEPLDLWVKEASFVKWACLRYFLITQFLITLKWTMLPRVISGKVCDLVSLSTAMINTLTKELKAEGAYFSAQSGYSKSWWENQAARAWCSWSHYHTARRMGQWMHTR